MLQVKFFLTMIDSAFVLFYRDDEPFMTEIVFTKRQLEQLYKEHTAIIDHYIQNHSESGSFEEFASALSSEDDHNTSPVTLGPDETYHILELFHPLYMSVIDQVGEALEFVQNSVFFFAGHEKKQLFVYVVTTSASGVELSILQSKQQIREFIRERDLHDGPNKTTLLGMLEEDAVPETSSFKVQVIKTSWHGICGLFGIAISGLISAHLGMTQNVQ